MKINLFKSDELEGRLEKISKLIRVPSDVKIDLAFDTIHALNDLTRSLAALHPHKKSIALLGAQPPPIDKLVDGFAAEGFTIQVLPVSFAAGDASSPGHSISVLRENFDKLKKDTLFILSSFAEPLTGALYPYDFIRTEAPKKNIFSLVYMSPDALKRGLIIPSTHWEAVVADPLWDGEHSLALVLKGDRCHGENLLWGQPHFSVAAVESLTNALSGLNAPVSSRDPDEKLVTEFESQIIAKLKGIKSLGAGVSRLFDRGVLFIEGVNGDSLVSALSSNSSSKNFITYSGATCGWNSPKLNSWLPQLGFSELEVQTSLLIPLKTLQLKDFLSDLTIHIESLRKISGYVRL